MSLIEVDIDIDSIIISILITDFYKYIKLIIITNFIFFLKI